MFHFQAHITLFLLPFIYFIPYNGHSYLIFLIFADDCILLYPPTEFIVTLMGDQHIFVA